MSELSEIPILFPVDTFLNVPQTVQPVLFKSSYSSVQPVLRHTMKELCHSNLVKQVWIECLKRFKSR